MSQPVNIIKKENLKFVAQIGIGGFSCVYQMTWASPQGAIEVAAKKLLSRDTHELEVLSKLSHPNIVKLLGVVDEEMEFMLILELCEGGSLRSYLDKHKHLSDDQFYNFARQAAIPIQYLKEMHIVHKDVKSPNYMLTTENVLKLGDFGLAKNIEKTMSNATETASYHWMAPELLKHGKLSPTYDIFAFAVVLWELWTGLFPHKGLESQVIAWKVCHENERLPIPADCPTPLADLMRQCWEADWKKRPSIEHVISVITTAAAAAAAAAQRTRQMQIINGPWALERTFGKQYGPGKSGKLSDAWGIAVSPNGDIAVTDNAEAQVKVYNNSDGIYKFSLDTTHGLEPMTISFPFQITVNSKGIYFVTDLNKYVQMYDVNGMFKSKWVSSCPHASYSPYLHGLAIDANDHLLVGDTRNMCINKHMQDGYYIASIKVSIGPKYLAVTSQDTIIVADWFKPPQIVSNTGQVLHTLRHPVDEYKWDPWGVHCNEGIIFIANQKTQDILCFSESGEYLGLIPVHSSLPNGITFIANNTRLLVCNTRSVDVYKIKQ